MKKLHYTALPLALVIIASIALTGCNFPSSPTDDYDNEATEGETVKGEAMEKDGEAMEKDGEAMEKDGEAMEKDGEAMEKDGEAMEKDGEAMEKDDSVSYKNAAPQYVKYAKADYEKDLGSRPIALFFHASWCPVCVKIDSEVNKDLANLPKGSKVIQVNYDVEKELKKKYGITTQSTIVFIDKDGKVSETLMSPSLDAIKTALKKTI